MWYYALNNQQLGPVDEEYIKNLVNSGAINGQTLVWTNGMAAWLPLSQTSLAALVGGVAPAPGTVPPAPPAVYAQPVYDPRAMLKSKEAYQLYDIMKWYKFYGFSLIFILLLYKGWEVVPDNSKRLSAWKAVGQLFIPLFNFYWIFVGIKGLPKELNDYIARNQVATPLVSEQLALWICILSLCVFVPFIGWYLCPLAVFILVIIFENKLKNALIAIYEHKAAQQ